MTKQELRARLTDLEEKCRAKNGPIFPRGSLHDLGVLCVICESCRARAVVLHALGLRTSPAIGPDEVSRRRLNRFERRVERQTPPEGRVNNLYEIEVREDEDYDGEE